MENYPSEVVYAGFGFQVERVVKWEHHPVYSEDGVDFLYNHITLGVVAVFNYAASATNARGGFGDVAPLSVKNLRHLMLQPRQQLTVRVGAVTVLESPARRKNKAGDFVSNPVFYPCDAKNGPNPLAFNVLSIEGVKTMVVYFEVETWINDCDGPPPFVSHRWQMQHEIDELHYTTRVVTGTIVFRRDYMLNFPGQTRTEADDFRARLAHPIPANFKREQVNVVMASDGVSCYYSFVDREQTLNLGQKNPVVKIEGTWAAGYYDDGVWSVAKRYVTLNIRVWGRRTSTRQQLINACSRAFAAFGFHNLPGDSPTLYWKVDLAVDVVDKFVEMTAGVFTAGAPDTLWQRYFKDVYKIGLKNLANFAEDIGDVAKIADGVNPRPPNGGGTRGTWAKRMVAQVLSNPCVPAARPPATESAVNKFLETDGTEIVTV